jgi:hypothetical protein
MNTRRARPERTIVMISTTKMTSLAAGLLLACGVSTVARADIPSAYSLSPGTVLSTHTPETNACPISDWQLWIEPHKTVRGEIEETRTNKTWDLAGTYDSHGTFHLAGHESADSDRPATVDAQVQSDGSMIFRMATVDDPSPCHNRTVYLPWFRNGNDFSPYGGGGDGSAG